MLLFTSKPPLLWPNRLKAYRVNLGAGLHLVWSRDEGDNHLNTDIKPVPLMRILKCLHLLSPQDIIRLHYQSFSSSVVMMITALFNFHYSPCISSFSFTLLFLWCNLVTVEWMPLGVKAYLLVIYVEESFIPYHWNVHSYCFSNIDGWSGITAN